MKLKTIRGVVNGVILEAMKGSGNYSYKLNDQATLAIKQLLKERMPKKKEHIALLSKKGLIFTGKLIEGRTVKDWTKYGFNQYHDEMEQVIEEI